MVKVISSDNKVKGVKNVIRREDVCPFKDGDFIKSKDEIYIVRCKNEQYYILSTNKPYNVKKIIPKDWTVFYRLT
jgi:hypothetical protein